MIWVRSRKFVESVWIPVVKTAVISITDPKDAEAMLPESEFINGILRLKFHDIPTPIEGYQEMTKEDADRIANFVASLKDSVILFLVHCEAGISRSAGIAAAMAKVLYGDDSFFYINYVPNSLTYRLTLEALNIHREEQNEC